MTDDIRRHGLPDESKLTTADLAAANQPKPRAPSQLVTETESESQHYLPVPGARDKSRINALAAAPTMERETGPLFSGDEAYELRSRWDAIQVAFVD